MDVTSSNILEEKFVLAKPSVNPFVSSTILVEFQELRLGSHAFGTTHVASIPGNTGHILNRLTLLMTFSCDDATWDALPPLAYALVDCVELTVGINNSASMGKLTGVRMAMKYYELSSQEATLSDMIDTKSVHCKHNRRLAIPIPYEYSDDSIRTGIPLCRMNQSAPQSEALCVFTVKLNTLAKIFGTPSVSDFQLESMSIVADSIILSDAEVEMVRSAEDVHTDVIVADYDVSYPIAINETTVTINLPPRANTKGIMYAIMDRNDNAQSCFNFWPIVQSYLSYEHHGIPGRVFVYPGFPAIQPTGAANLPYTESLQLHLEVLPSTSERDILIFAGKLCRLYFNVDGTVSSMAM